MFKNITLELSLKPFKKTDNESIRAVCSQMFDDWALLLRDRECISVMMWCADGSEILDYNRNLDDEFEWCKYIGTANKKMLPSGMPLETSLHSHKQLYMENPPRMTYKILKNIVSTIKEEGKKRFPNAKIRVGETFDIGPEFAVSTFKYERHTEICEGASNVDGVGFVDSTALLHADSRSYAAYPNGIPEGEPFGLFLGKQANIFLKEIGFDYIWLSNGLGFSADPWSLIGKIFDSEQFYPEKLSATSDKVFKFWKLFREGCPDYLIETRGTNNTVGIDYATDGVPLHDIYNASLNIIAPPNSPWAAINKNYGLEIAGQMSRCCELPSETFPFRYYLHDPWWVNSPWYDRYEGVPTDIYIPMAISRIDEQGRVHSANSLNLLSVDNSYGEMPKSCVYEPLSHILKAEKEVPDAIPPLVWIYPMREYTTAKSEYALRQMYFGDKYICDAINEGLPLCAVCSADIFKKQNTDIYTGRVLIVPVYISADVLKNLTLLTKKGICVILYGSGEAIVNAQKAVAPDSVRCIDIDKGTTPLFDALSDFGYTIKFDKKAENAKSPLFSLSRHDGAFMFSVYNPNATTDTTLSMPLGAPIMIGADVQVQDKNAIYRFPKFTRGECRIFVTQEDGIVECNEMPPVNARYRRKIKIGGLKNAKLYFFGETEVDDVMLSRSVDPIDETPIEEEGALVLCNEDSVGKCYCAENLSGDFVICIGKKSR